MRDADGDRLLGVETCDTGLSACVASTRLWRGGAHESLKSMGRVGGLIIYHGVMLKVELD